MSELALGVAAGLVGGCIITYLVVRTFARIEISTLKERLRLAKKSNEQYVDACRRNESRIKNLEDLLKKQEEKWRQANNKLSLLRGAFKTGNITNFVNECMKHLNVDYKFIPDEAPNGRRGAHTSGPMTERGPSVRKQEL